jgi:hypothetical protein
MPFNYQSLKNLTDQAIVDGSIDSVDIADGAVTGTKIQLGNVTSGKLASGAVDLGSSTTTGTLPINKGGTNVTSLGGAYRALYSDGSNLQFNPHGIQGMQVFTGSGTWSRPSGVRYIRVQVQGAGGGGSGHGEGGGAGGYSERYLDVTGISSVSVYVGGGGSGTYYSGAGGNGDYAGFGPYCSAGGGHGANRQNQHSGGVSGVGSGGNLNLHQGGGFSHHAYSAQSNADTFWGGGAPSSHPQGGHFAHNHQTHCAPGTGGAGAHFHGHRGSDGRPGLVVVTSFY